MLYNKQEEVITNHPPFLLFFRGILTTTTKMFSMRSIASLMQGLGGVAAPQDTVILPSLFASIFASLSEKLGKERKQETLLTRIRSQGS